MISPSQNRVSNGIFRVHWFRLELTGFFEIKVNHSLLLAWLQNVNSDCIFHISCLRSAGSQAKTLQC